MVSAPGTLDLSASSAIILYDRNDGNPIFLSWIVSNNTGSVTITELDLEGGTVSGIYNPFLPSAYVSTVTGNIEISSAEEDGISGYKS